MLPSPPITVPPSLHSAEHAPAAHAMSEVALQDVTADAHMLLKQEVHAAPVEYVATSAQPPSAPPLLLPLLLLAPLLLPLPLPPLDEPPPSWPPPEDDPFEASSPNPVLLLLLEHATTAARPARVTVKMALCISALRPGDVPRSGHG
jgi:hypothetical protein